MSEAPAAPDAHEGPNSSVWLRSAQVGVIRRTWLFGVSHQVHLVDGRSLECEPIELLVDCEHAVIVEVDPVGLRGASPRRGDSPNRLRSTRQARSRASPVPRLTGMWATPLVERATRAKSCATASQGIASGVGRTFGGASGAVAARDSRTAPGPASLDADRLAGCPDAGQEPADDLRQPR